MPKADVDIRSEVGAKPYRQFWSRVILTAVDDWLSLRNSDDPEMIKISKEAANWLFDDREVARPAPLTFQWVCEILDWEYRTRQSALKRYGEQVSDEEFFDI